MNVEDTLLFSTVRIDARGAGNPSVGTGFFFEYPFPGEEGGVIPCLVTNLHVVEGYTEIRIHLHLAGPDGRPTGKHEIRCTSPWIRHPAGLDLAILPINHVFADVESRGLRVFYRPLGEGNFPLQNGEGLEGVRAIEDISMVGYPIGLWDAHNNRPIIRRGTTATSPLLDYMGKPEFLIDAAVFPGSSGSPVFLHEEGLVRLGDGLTPGVRFMFLGVLSDVYRINRGEMEVVPIPTTPATVPVTGVMINLGVVIKSRALMDFDPILVRLVEAIRNQNSSVSPLPVEHR